MHSLSLSTVEIQKYLEYINTLKYQQEPDYEFIRKLFKDGLKRRGGADDGKNVRFTMGKVTSPSTSAATTELCNGHSSPEKETRDKAAQQRPAAKVRGKGEKYAKEKQSDEAKCLVVPPNPNTVSDWRRTCHMSWVKTHQLRANQKLQLFIA